jgi:D-sedoheptulose 7-phosphate isomerase
VDFIRKYLSEVADIANLIDTDKIASLIEELVRIKSNNGRLFILGVGGSAGNASHAVNDFRKLAGIESYAPTDNVSELTARTNDEGWETVFIEYLRISKLNSSDGILILSVGGGDTEKRVSVNLCNAIDYANKQKAKTFGIVGRENGYTNLNADVCLLIPNVNHSHLTQHSEAYQAVIWHLLVSHPMLKENSTKW